MSITLLPDPPTRADPLNFATRADAFLPALVVFGEEANALAIEVNGYATSASSSAASAGTSASAAAVSANAAQSAANYVGEWGTLFGPLNMPASVSYQGQFYVLNTSVLDVTAHTPGVSSVWSVNGLYRPYTSISVNTNAQAFLSYRVTANCNVTLPASPTNGQWVQFINSTGTSSFTVLRNGKTIMGLAENLTVNVNNKGFTLIYSAGTNDWLIFG